jgi:hypothetical protein
MTIVMGTAAYIFVVSIPRNIAAAYVGELSVARRNQARLREWGMEKHSSISFEKHSSQQKH